MARCVCPTGGKAFQLAPVCLILLEALLAMGGLEAMGENSWRAAWNLQRAERAIQHKQKVWGDRGEGEPSLLYSLVFFKPVLSDIAGAVSVRRRRESR